MSKIIVIGVGDSQFEAIEKMHQQMPEAKCVHITCNWYNNEHSEGIYHHNLIENSNLAKEIFSSYHPGSACEIVRQEIAEIVEEQADAINKLLD